MNIRWLWISLFIIALDQWTKHLAVSHLLLGQPYEVTPFFNLSLAFNPGGAFSLLASQSNWARWALASISIIVSFFVLLWIIYLPKGRYWLATSLSFILGGAIGNLYDRLHHGVVVDFLQLHYKDIYYYPTFNIADSFVVTGAIMLIIHTLFLSKRGA